MKRLDQYLIGEMLLPLFCGVFLIMVMLVGTTLFQQIEQIAKYGIPFLVIAKLVVFNLPSVLVLTLPAGTAVAAAWAVNRMARDSEITAIRMAGVPLRRLFLPIYALGLATSLIAFLVGDRVAPPAFREFLQTQAQMGAYALQGLPEVASDTVFKFQDYSFHINQVHKDPGGDVNKLNLVGVTIFQNPPAGQGFPRLYTARSATYDHDVWTLHDVIVHIMDTQGQETYEVSYKAPGHNSVTLDLHVPLGSLMQSATNTPDTQNMGELGAQMRALASTGQRGTDLYDTIAVNYYLKLSLPFLCLAFALCAPPLVMRFSRNGAYTGIFLSILMVWVAWNTLFLGKVLGVSGKLAPVLAAWAPDALFLALGLFFLWQME